MVSSTVRQFSDVYQYQSSVRAATDIQLLVTKAGELKSNHIRIDLHRLWMQGGNFSLPIINHTALMKTRRPVFFAGEPDRAAIYHNGQELAADSLVFYSEGAEYYNRFDAGSSWAAMSLSPADLAAAAQALLGRDLEPPAASKLLRVPLRFMTRLRHLHAAAGHLAATVPDILAHPEVARAIEQELVRAMVACLGEGIGVNASGLSDLRVPVMRRFERVIEENPERALYVAEMCAAIRVSERTLRLRCTEELGVSPHQYLRLRRMHLVRQALNRADPAETTVTEIAVNYGFAELGRFSVGYRTLFGEPPSATLRRPPREPPASEDMAAARVSGLERIARLPLSHS